MNTIQGQNPVLHQDNKQQSASTQSVSSKSVNFSGYISYDSTRENQSTASTNTMSNSESNTSGETSSSDTGFLKKNDSRGNESGKCCHTSMY